MSLKQIVFLAALFLSVSDSYAKSESYQECIQRIKVKKLAPVEEVKKVYSECREIALMPEATSKQKERFENFYRLCKRFRIKQTAYLDVEIVRIKLESCRGMAELYAKAEDLESESPCSTQVCSVSQVTKKEKCSQEVRHNGVARGFCRRIIVPFQCMRTPKHEASIVWKDYAKKGKLNCKRI